LIALAGGVLEYARIDSITVLREEQGLTRAIRFNYNDVSRGQRLEQNILLQPGDTVVIP
jgi:polysaccharide export outer membrane protein